MNLMDILRRRAKVIIPTAIVIAILIGAGLALLIPGGTKASSGSVAAPSRSSTSTSADPKASTTAPAQSGATNTGTTTTQGTTTPPPTSGTSVTPVTGGTTSTWPTANSNGKLDCTDTAYKAAGIPKKIDPQAAALGGSFGDNQALGGAVTYAACLNARNVTIQPGMKVDDYCWMLSAKTDHALLKEGDQAFKTFLDGLDHQTGSNGYEASGEDNYANPMYEDKTYSDLKGDAWHGTEHPMCVQTNGYGYGLAA